MVDSEDKAGLTGSFNNPFPGLRPFRTDEAHLFFGRHKQTEEVLNKLLSGRFCAVTGASGSGKSSLIYCGIITSLQNISGIEQAQWKVLTSRPGNIPVSTLLKKAGELAGKPVEDVLDDPGGFSLILRKLFPEESSRLLIIIDQFEEVFRYHDDELRSDTDTPSFFTRMLTSLVNQEQIPVYLIITMRSDFIGECSRFPDFTALINNSNYLVPRMAKEDFREVIVGPVKAMGASIEEGLIDIMLEDLGDNPDQLPVLQHALMRTWDNWKLHNDFSRPITISDYEAVGRLEKALSEHANEAYDELNEREKEVCEKVFRTITEKGTDNKGVRKPVRLDKLAEITSSSREELVKVLDTFRSQGRSFITPSIENVLSDETVVDISHESFMRIWDRLRAWVDEEATSVQLYKRLSESAFQYQMGHTGLWRPPDLHLAVNWRKKNHPTLAWAERHNPAYERTMAFLDTSEHEFQMEEENKLRLQKRQLKRTRLFATVLGSAAIVSMGLFIWTRELQIKSEHEFQRAETQRQLAEIKTIEAEEQRELAEKAASEAMEQRSLAEDQSRIAEQQRMEAERNALEAQRQTSLATRNLSEANRQRSLALASEQEANIQKEQAVLAREEAFQRRMLTIAKSMAVKSLQVTTDNDMRALLAYQAFLFNQRYNGFENDVDIYTGLYEALKYSVGNNYNVFPGHKDAVSSARFIPGTESFITAGVDGSIRKWDVNDPSKNNTLISDGRNLIETIKISHDGKWLICAENKNGILLFNLQSGDTKPLLLKGIDNNIRAMDIAPDNRYLYTAGTENIIEYWDLNDGKSHRFADPGTRVNSLSLSPDGILLAGGTRDGRLIVWRTKSETISSEIYNDPSNAIHSVAFDPGFKYLAAGNIKGDILIFSADNFELVRILSGHTARITDLCFSPDGKILASSSYDGNVIYWNTMDLTSPPIIMSDHSGFAFTTAFSSDGNYLVSGSSEGNRLICRIVYSSLLAEDFCRLVSRNLTEEEWVTYVGADIPYEETCNNVTGLSTGNEP